MKTNLEFLIHLIGQTEAETILQDYVKKNWNGKSTITRTVHTNGTRRRVLGAKPWTSESEDNLIHKANNLRAMGMSWNKICKSIAAELYRTPSSIGNRIGKLQKQGRITK